MTWSSSVRRLKDYNACWTYVLIMANPMISYLIMTRLCACICQPTPAFYINTPAVFLNGRRLSFTVKYKYLGTLMTHDGSDEANLSRQGLFYARSNGLSKNVNACSPSVKATLFRTFCSNMYRGHLGHDFRKSALRKLIVGYNHSFRFLMKFHRNCSASGMFVSNCVPSFMEMWRKYIYMILHNA